MEGATPFCERAALPAAMRLLLLLLLRPGYCRCVEHCICMLSLQRMCTLHFSSLQPSFARKCPLTARRAAHHHPGMLPARCCLQVCLHGEARWRASLYRVPAATGKGHFRGGCSWWPQAGPRVHQQALTPHWQLPLPAPGHWKAPKVSPCFPPACALTRPPSPLTSPTPSTHPPHPLQICEKNGQPNAVITALKPNKISIVIPGVATKDKICEWECVVTEWAYTQ